MDETPLQSRRRFLRFSLKGLALGILVFGVLMAWTVQEAKQQRTAIAELAKVGCECYSDEDFPVFPSMLELTRMLLGDEQPRNVTFLFAGCCLGMTDAEMVYVEFLPQLSGINLGGTGVTDAGLAHLHGLSKLQHIELTATKVTDTGAQELQKALPNCRISR